MVVTMFVFVYANTTVFVLFSSLRTIFFKYHVLKLIFWNLFFRCKKQKKVLYISFWEQRAAIFWALSYSFLKCMQLFIVIVDKKNNWN